MSETHGDKARFGKRRKKGILRRKRVRELSKALSLEKKEDNPGRAQVQASRLNAQEAPELEVELQKQQDEEKSAAGKKARPVSKAKSRS